MTPSSPSTAALPSVPPHLQRGKVRGLLELQVDDLELLGMDVYGPLQAWISWQTEGRSRRVGVVPVEMTDNTIKQIRLQYVIRTYSPDFKAYCRDIQRCTLVIETRGCEPTEVGCCAIDVRPLDLSNNIKNKAVHLKGPKGGSIVGSACINLTTRYGEHVERDFVSSSRTSPASARTLPAPVPHGPSISKPEGSETDDTDKVDEDTDLEYDVGSFSLPALFAALSERLEREHPPIFDIYKAIDASHGEGSIGPEQAVQILDDIFPLKAMDAQMEFLVAILDADLDCSINYHDLTSSLREWKAFSVGSSEVTDALSNLGGLLRSRRGAGLQSLAEALAARGSNAASDVVKLSEAVLLLRAGLPPMSDREDRRYMTYLGTLDVDGEGSTTLGRLLEALGLGLEEVGLAEAEPPTPVPHGPQTVERVRPGQSSPQVEITPMFVRAANSAYRNFMSAAMAESDEDSMTPPLSHTDLASLEQRQADHILGSASDDESSSSSIYEGTPYYEQEEVTSPEKATATAQLSLSANPLWGGGSQQSDSDAMSKPSLAPSPPPAALSGVLSEKALWGRCLSKQNGHKDSEDSSPANAYADRHGQEDLELQIMELQAELLATRAVNSAKSEIASSLGIQKNVEQPEASAAESLLQDTQVELESVRREQQHLQERLVAIQEIYAAEQEESERLRALSLEAEAQAEALHQQVDDAREAEVKSSSALESARQELEELEREAAEWREERTELSEQLEELKASEMRTQQQLTSAADVWEELTFVNRKMEGLVVDLEESNRVIADFEGQKEAWQRDREAMEAQQADMQTKLSEAQEAATASEGELKAELEAAKEDLLAMKATASPSVAGESQHGGSNDELLELESQLALLERAAAQWEADEADLLQQLSDQKAERAQLEKEMRAALDRADTLEKTVAGLRAAVAAVTEAKETQAPTSAAAAAAAPLQVQVAEQPMQHQSEALARQESGTSVPSTPPSPGMAKQLRSLTAERNDLANEMAALKDQVVAICAEKNDIASEAEALQKQLDAAVDEKSGLSAEVEALRLQNRSLARQKADLAEENSSLQGQVDALVSQRSDVSAGQAGLKQQFQALTSESTDLKAETAALQKQVDALVAEKSDLVEECEALQSQLEEQSADTWEEDRAQMMQQLMALSQEKSRLEAELQGLHKHTVEMEQLMEEMQSGAGAEGGVSESMLQELHQEHLEEQSYWEQEKAQLEAKVSELKATLAERTASATAAALASAENEHSGGGGGVSTLLLEELHQQHMDEAAEWEAEKASLQAELQAAISDRDGLMSQPATNGATPDPAEAADEAQSKPQADGSELQNRCAELEEEVTRLRDAVAHAPSATELAGGGVSSLLMEELHEQHMEELAEWEAERKQLQAQLSELQTDSQAGELEAQMAYMSEKLAIHAGAEAALQLQLDNSEKEQAQLIAEVRALRAALESTSGALEPRPMEDAAELLVSDAMAGAREFMLEQQVEELKQKNQEIQAELECAVTEHAELLKNPLWETEVPEEEWRAELEEQQAMIDSLVEEHAAMEQEIVSAHGEKQMMDAKMEGILKEKKALQSQLNMVMISMTDNGNQIHIAEQEKERLQDEIADLKEQLDQARRGLGGAPEPAKAPPPAATAAAGGPVSNGLSSKREKELLENLARLEDEVDAAEENCAQMTQQLMVLTQEKSRADANLKKLQAEHVELEQLMQEMQEHSAQPQEENGGGYTNGNGGMVSSLLLEELHQQHMEEMSEWETERKRLQSDIVKLQELRAQAGAQEDPEYVLNQNAQLVQDSEQQLVDLKMRAERAETALEFATQHCQSLHAELAEIKTHTYAINQEHNSKIGALSQRQATPVLVCLRGWLDLRKGLIGALSPGQSAAQSAQQLFEHEALAGSIEHQIQLAETTNASESLQQDITLLSKANEDLAFEVSQRLAEARKARLEAEEAAPALQRRVIDLEHELECVSADARAKAMALAVCQAALQASEAGILSLQRHSTYTPHPAVSLAVPCSASHGVHLQEIANDDFIQLRQQLDNHREALAATVKDLQEREQALLER